tara:strand:- start:1425 stop:2189 length:765 start_codon:yes stop_codon:yes gene_type:complete
VGGLAHYIEDEGVPTTQISLVRPHTETIRPPRALWVPYELGRPLGVPGDAAFQRRILSKVLSLLERGDGPALLEDHDEEAPLSVAADEGEGWACPISLPSLPVDLEAGGGFKAAIEDEVRMLTPWYDMAVSERGRTTVGLSGLAIEDVVNFLSGLLDGATLIVDGDGLEPTDRLRLAVDDLKAFYREAAAAQPGRNSGQQVNDWFYGETAAGKALYALRPRLSARADETDDAALKRYAAALLIPRSQGHRAASI